MHHVYKLALLPDKYAYLPAKVMKLVEQTNAYKQTCGLDLQSPDAHPECRALADTKDAEESRVEVVEDGGEPDDNEEGEEEQAEDDPEVEEDIQIPDFEDKDGCKQLRASGALDQSDDSSVEIVGFKGPNKVDKSPMPIQTESKTKRSSNPLTIDDDDSSGDARAAPAAPGKRGGQKFHKLQRKQPKLMQPKPKAKAATGDCILVGKPGSSGSSDPDPKLKPPFYLGERKPQASRPGEWYILQAPGGPGARYSVDTSRSLFKQKSCSP